MREVERIDRIQEKISQLWKGVPDMRYFQFITYLASQTNYEGDLFFYEDGAFEKVLDKLLEGKND